MEIKITERIRALRKEKRILAKEVARHLGISRSAYTLIEGGKRRLTAAHVRKIARLLDVSVAELYGEAAPRRELVKAFKHIRPINTPALWKKLKPILGDRTGEVIDCIQIWTVAPEALKRALAAFCEAKETEDDRSGQRQ